VFISTQSTGAINGNFIAAGDFLIAGSSSLQTSTSNTNMLARSRNSLGASYTAKVTGFFGKSRSTSASFDYRFSSTTGTTSSTSETPVNDNIFVFQGNAATPSPTNARLAFYSIGESLNLALLDARVTRLIAETTFTLNTGLTGTGYNIDTLNYVNAGYAAGGTLA
jgi:hypothetical protein